MKNMKTQEVKIRSGFGAGMTELGHENVVALCADLIGSLNLTILRNHPERFFKSESGT
jgi:transketolase C-terminal domain/subunit